MTVTKVTLTSADIRSRFLAFFAARGHAVIPSASLVPENDPSVLFNTAGMQPLVPYLLGDPHPAGVRLASVQKCVRTQDIDEVGDNTHDTFFEMLGNWSLGDYFKEEAIMWSYEFLTSEDEGLGLDPQRLYVTVFGGNNDAPQDLESFNIWKKFIPEHRIYFLNWNGKKEPNWWDAGENGPSGPDTEMFYDVTESGLGNLTKEEYLKADDEQKVVEIWNDVFMQYLKKDGKVVGLLPKKNVDTGSGLERIVMAVQKKDNIFDTDLFLSAMNFITSIATQGDLRAKRIVADHIRTAVFMIADGVVPSNTDRGYILRRIIRRAVRYGDILGLKQGKNTERSDLATLAEVFIKQYMSVPAYNTLATQANMIFQEIENEENKFRKTLEHGLKEFQKGTDPFILFTSYGFPFELTKELALENGVLIDEVAFQEQFKTHQELSRAGAEQKFKGGLGGTGVIETRYHTATHLLHQTLRDVLGTEVGQKGSNITPDRLRFDFSFSRKMTDEEKTRVEDIVNEKIKSALPVNKIILKKEDALKTGALHFFGDKYGDEVSVYSIGGNIGESIDHSLENAYSKEFCGGPHVANTSELGHFKITKEEAVSAGVRRIKAVLE